MDTFMIVFALALMMAISVPTTEARNHQRKHVIYWDPEITPKLKDNDFTYHVEIGQFMDILCPLKEISKSDTFFDIYNVTEDGYRTCNSQNRQPIFSCDRPEAENKLTIKFQQISPSPFGFRFQYCEDYYFIAVPRFQILGHETRRNGCHNQSMRMKLKVGCKERKTTTTTTATTTTTTTTTTTPPPATKQSYLEMVRQKALQDKNKNMNVPELVTVSTPINKSGRNQKLPVVAPSQARVSPGNGGNGASSLSNFSRFSAAVSSLLTILWLFHITS